MNLNLFVVCLSIYDSNYAKFIHPKNGCLFFINVIFSIPQTYSEQKIKSCFCYMFFFCFFFLSLQLKYSCKVKDPKHIYILSYYLYKQILKQVNKIWFLSGFRSYICYFKLLIQFVFDKEINFIHMYVNM